MDVAYDFVLTLSRTGKKQGRDPKVVKLLDELLLRYVRLTGVEETK